MSKARVLVVDDEPGMLHSIGRVLGGTYEVAGARSAAEAHALVPIFQPDLAILDIRMPEADGFELLATLKAQRPDLDLIMMTGSVTDTDAKLVRAIREKAFYFIQKPFDREVLRTIVARCLELRRLTEENRRHVARLESELSAAREFQQSLLPPEREIVENVEIEARYLPCSELGGDFYDYAAACDGRVTLIVADVSGHGASAAMLTGIVKAAFHSALVEAYEPASVVVRIADGVRRLADNVLVTVLVARISPRERYLEYVNAGHPAGVLFGGAREPQQLASTAPFVSPAIPWSRWEPRTLGIEPGEQLFLCTDGLLEAQGESGELGFERVLAELRTHDGGPRALVERLLTLLSGHLAGRPSQDDVTLLAAAPS